MSLREERPSSRNKRWKSLAEHDMTAKRTTHYSDRKTADYQYGYAVEFRIQEGDTWVEKTERLYFMRPGQQTPASNVVLKKYPNARIVSVGRV